MKIVAFIPARSGSKGLPDKNIKELLGRPLISYSIEAARLCPKISEVYLNSDSEEYLKIGESYGAKPFLRPRELSTDTSTMKSVLEHFSDTLTARKEFYDAIIVLYPVYPVRNHEDLSGIIEAFEARDKKVPLIGLRQPKTHPFLCYEKDSSGHIASVMEIDENKYYRRQQYPEYYELTLWACITPPGSIPSMNAQLICRDTIGYVLPPDVQDVNIDTQADFDYAEYLLRKLRARAAL